MRRRSGAKSIHRPAGANETADGIVVSQPRTVLAVDVTVEKDVTLSGPYARYAQKFLGVRASAHRQDRLGRYRSRRGPARCQGMPRRTRPGRAFAPRP